MDLAGLSDLLDDLMRHEPAEPTGDDVLALTAGALAAFWVADAGRCTIAATRAAEAATTDLELTLAGSALALAAAFGGPPVSHWPVEESLALDDAPVEEFARLLLAEAALSCARLDVATRIVDGGPSWRAWEDHSWAVMMAGTSVRVLAFAGRIAEAAALLPALHELAGRHGHATLASAVESLVTGNADRPDETARAVEHLLAAAVAPTDRLGRGVHLLAAFGAVATGDVRGAAALVLVAGGQGLAGLTVIDRSLALEILVAAAVDEGDVDAAQAWLAQGAPIADHPIARPALDRAVARVAAMEGDLEVAETHARRAVDGARAEGRGVEVAEGEVVLASTRVARGDHAGAARGLRDAVNEADASGHHAVRRSATTVLRRAGRRLPPVAAGGWDVLSPREREVAQLILAGLDTPQVADALFVSTSTVRVHTTRVLTAFAVGTRIALLARLGPRGEPGPPPPPLTPRQAQVVELVAGGATNAEVAAALGIGVKAVEKHVGDALDRWGVDTRFALALRWWRDHHEPALVSEAIPTSGEPAS